MAHYSYEDLAARLTDLKHLAFMPKKGEKAYEQSSTDKRSRYDKERDLYIDWDANADSDGILHTLPDGGRVLAAMEGPGCLWRIWFALPCAKGRIKIFLDGGETPVIDCSPTELFGGGPEPFNLPNLCYEQTSGYNCYIPIPFNHSCLVVGYSEFGAYYQFSYSCLEKGASVESFRLPLPQAHLKALRQADRLLSGFSPDSASFRHELTVDVSPGTPQTVLNVNGEGALTCLRMRPDQTGWRVLKALCIVIYWDNESTPSVWAPFCDFFGGTCGKNEYKSYPLGICDDGWFYCRWYMPYATGARIVLVNDGQTPVSVDCEIYEETLAQIAESHMRFHAKWNRDCFQPERTDRSPDYTLLRAEGSGRFLGCALHVYKPVDNHDSDASPGDYWWGEGDEKFFVDGEKFPSIFGTGSEDYFGFAWAWPYLFGRPYHAQNFNQGGIHNRGNRSFARFHISDSIPYFTSIEVCIEKYYSNRFARYAVTPYWYMPAGQPDLYKPECLSARIEYYEEDPEHSTQYHPLGAAFANSGFALGNLSGWTLMRGGAFENARVQEYESGNLFTYSSDCSNGTVSELISPHFTITGEYLDFLLGGTWYRDPDHCYTALMDTADNSILARACCTGPDMRRVIWDISGYIGKVCVFKIIDEGKEGFRTLSFTDIRIAGKINN